MADNDDGGQAATFTREQVEAEVKGLKEKNSELLGKLSKASEFAKQFEGLDPERVKAALKAQEDAEAKKAKEDGDWDAREKALRESFTAEHTKVLAPIQEELATLRRDLFDAVAVRDALEAMGKPDVRGNPKLLLPVIRGELGVEVIDGQRVTVVKGPDGKPRFHPTTGARVTVEDRLKELRAQSEFAAAFAGTGASGSGASGGGGSSGASAIRAGDDKAFLANLDKIAKGEVKVAQ